MLLTPEYIFRAIEVITPEFLRQHGITALVLDVDNTLTGDGSQQLDATVQQWLDTMRAAGVRLTIVSNNTAARVRPFADRVGIPCLYTMPRGGDHQRGVQFKRRFEPYWLDRYYQKGGRLYE